MATRYKLIHSGKKLSDLSATTSAELAGVISDETGSGLLVFSNAPTFDTTIGFKGSISGTTTLKAAPVASTYTVTLPEATTTLVGTGTTNTLTNKRITKRTDSTTSSATPTINTDNVDMYLLTAQAVDITSFTTNLSGTPTEGQLLWISITGTGARAITWGSSFESSTVSLPTTTVSTNRLDVGFVWNTVTSKWRCIASA